MKSRGVGRGSNKGRPWTPEECSIAAEMMPSREAGFRAQRKAVFEIAKRLNRTINAIYGRYYDYGATFRDKRPRYRRPLDVLRHAVLPFAIPAEVQAERELRSAMEHSSITAALMGDPLPGRSALDKMR